MSLNISLVKPYIFNDYNVMKPVLKLDTMTKAEKLQAMEELWQDLSRVEEEIDSPDWHLDVLKEREAMLKEGKDDFIPWEAAKKELREGKK